MSPFFLLLALWSFFYPQTIGEVHTVAFYNVENLFDPVNDPKHFDEEYTPEGRKQWTQKLLKQKIRQIASVIAQVGTEETKASPLFVGLAEVENDKVIAQLTRHPLLKDEGYRIAHRESRDPRGIDVALLYKASVFNLKNIKKYPLTWQNETNRRNYYSRDILVVGGYIRQHKVNLLINHWPSRRGGIKRSQPLRHLAAQLHNRIVDSLHRIDPETFIISMGDFNDNPNDKSLKEIASHGLFNPMGKLHKQGKGSLAYRDRWFLFDQVLFSKPWKKSSDLFWITSKIFSKPELYTPKGRYKGYPYRTALRGDHLEGYSDHLPVYSIIGIKD